MDPKYITKKCYICCISLIFLLFSHEFIFQLPIKLDIIKHPSEVDGKSTSAHAAILAPEDVNIYTYPTIPDYEPKDRVINSIFQSNDK